uniref:Twisted gastrulation protein homolog 1-A-like n=1 Tax=Sinocyclocheilus anshuiensis TaxID=1608454 RepID=A0A671L5T1_9TELE
MFFVSLGGFLLTLAAERSRCFLQDSRLSSTCVWRACLCELDFLHIISFSPLYVCLMSEGNCSCCKECMLCLSSLWEECCDCVGMCNPRNYNDSPATSKSTVEELYRPIPSLSLIISSSPSLLSPRPLLSSPLFSSPLLSSSPPLLLSSPLVLSYGLCTVVYFDDCVSIRQCKQYCESMGGSKYRWFHNACCECIGPECLDYGSKAVKCMNCLI